MKNITSLSNGLSHLKFNEKATAQKKIGISPEAISIVNDLFTDLKGICTAWKTTFTDSTIEQSAKKQWAQAFIENGIINKYQIDIGMVKARRLAKPWFPSSGEFISWCKPSLEDFGLMPVEQALRIAVNGQSKKHPAIYAAVQATGSWALRTMSHKRLLPLFARNYEIACLRVMAGEDLSQEIPLALPRKVVVITGQTQAIKNVAALRQLLKTGGVAL